MRVHTDISNVVSLKNWELSLKYKNTFYFRKNKKFIISIYGEDALWKISVCHNKSCNLIYMSDLFNSLSKAILFAEKEICVFYK